MEIINRLSKWIFKYFYFKCHVLDLKLNVGIVLMILHTLNCLITSQKLIKSLPDFCLHWWIKLVGWNGGRNSLQSLNLMHGGISPSFSRNRRLFSFIPAFVMIVKEVQCQLFAHAGRYLSSSVFSRGATLHVDHQKQKYE